MRQEGCSSPVSEWDSELDQTERIQACDALRTCWEELLLTQGRKDPVVKQWEELKRWGLPPEEPSHSDEEIMAALGSKYREKMERFSQEGRSYSLRIGFKDARATLRAIGFPLEKSQIVLTIDKWFPFQFNDIVSQAKPAFLIGPKGNGMAIAASVEKMDLESGKGEAYGADMPLERIISLHSTFRDGTFKAVSSQERRANTKQPAPVTGLRKIIMGFAGRFTSRAA